MTELSAEFEKHWAEHITKVFTGMSPKEYARYQYLAGAAVGQAIGEANGAKRERERIRDGIFELYGSSEFEGSQGRIANLILKLIRQEGEGV